MSTRQTLSSATSEGSMSMPTLDLVQEAEDAFEVEQLTSAMMQARAGEWTSKESVLVRCMTWNVCGEAFSSIDYDSIDIFACLKTADSHIVAIGLQEMVDLTASNVVFDRSKTEERLAYWTTAFQSALDMSGEKYQLLSRGALVGVALMVFIKQSLIPYAYDVRLTTTGVGALGVMGNKGAVTIGFRLHDSSVCFVSSHLASGRNKVVPRSIQYRSILEKTALMMSEESTRNRPWHHNGHRKFVAKEGLSILDYDLVFWVGDLNYHIDQEMSIEEVFRLVENRDWATLRLKDQLISQRESRQAFAGFREAELNFAPTYKYLPGSNDYDRREDKLRAPAWCDRVLWYADRLVDDVTCLDYERLETCLSDHKPVVAAFKFLASTILREKELEILNTVRHKLDRVANEARPRLSLDNQRHELGRMMIGVCRHTTVIL